MVNPPTSEHDIYLFNHMQLLLFFLSLKMNLCCVISCSHFLLIYKLHLDNE